MAEVITIKLLPNQFASDHLMVILMVATVTRSRACSGSPYKKYLDKRRRVLWKLVLVGPFLLPAVRLHARFPPPVRGGARLAPTDRATQRNHATFKLY